MGINITKEQTERLRPYLSNIDELLENGDLLEFELSLDQAIVEYGLDENDEITPTGIELQRLYDQIYNQND